VVVADVLQRGGDGLDEIGVTDDGGHDGAFNGAGTPKV
jgi:hypothetical protein